MSGSHTKFSKLTSQELYGRQKGELLLRSWELKGEEQTNYPYFED